jgi:DNA-binding MarR family transcriptional regulator
MSEKFKYAGAPKTWPQVQVLRRIWVAAMTLRAKHEPHFAELNLPMIEFDLLAALGNTDGLRMKDLAHAMITTPSNVTRVCAVMEEKGLITRERSKTSDREVIARLTPTGEKLFHDTFAKTVNHTAAVLDAALDRAELEQLAALLDKLLQGLARESD